MKISRFALPLVIFSNSLYSLKAASICEENLGNDFKNDLDISLWPTLNGNQNRQRDDAIAFFISGNYVCTKGAEMEGKIVVLGDFSISNSGLSNVVNVGQGSQVVPNENQVVMTVGGNLSLGRYLDFFTTDSGSLRLGGTVSGPGGFWLPGPDYVNSPLSNTESNYYDNMIDDLKLKSVYWSTLPINGYTSRADAWAPLVFHAGDNQDLQVFDIRSDELVFAHGTVVKFASSLRDKTILINVRSATGTVASFANIGNMKDPDGGSNHHFGPKYTASILWNFYDATEVNIGDYSVGNGEFIGTILAPGPGNGGASLTLTVPGHSGQVIVNGDVNQDFGGSEWHNYPFDPFTPLPEHPDCVPPVPAPTEAPVPPPTDAPVPPPTDAPVPPPTDAPVPPPTDAPVPPPTDAPVPPPTDAPVPPPTDAPVPPPTDAPVPPPTDAPVPPPTDAPVSSPVKISGDPHIKAWNGDHYDFHGVCDLVMLKNPSFDNGVGMDIHVRTKRTKQWSYISSAVLRIGEETLEVKADRKGSQYWINSVAGGDLQSLNGFTVTHNQINGYSMEYIVYLNGGQRIIMKTFKEMVGVEIVGATENEFGSSLGLMGTFGEGLKLGRDRVLIEDNMQFGQEWQVQASEPMLFHDVEGPQAPVRCEIPQATTLRRRLDESKISFKEAELACSRVASDDFDSCVFDIIATSDIESAGMY